MDDTTQTLERQRFVAYSMQTRMPVLAGVDPTRLLAEARAIPSLGFEGRFVEILDCGATGPDASKLTLRLEAARGLYRTVFRGSGSLSQPGMPPLPLQGPTAVLPDHATMRSMANDLASLIDRADAMGLDRLASTLRRIREQVREGPEGWPQDGHRDGVHDVQP